MLRAMYERLEEAYGPQHWWPGETPLEVTLGAYLTQNTSWRAVERSLGNLRDRGLLDAAGLLATPEEELRSLLRPSGYMVRKSAAIRAFLGFLFAGSGRVVRATSGDADRSAAAEAAGTPRRGAGDGGRDSTVCTGPRGDGGGRVSATGNGPAWTDGGAIEL